MRSNGAMIVNEDQTILETIRSRFLGGHGAIGRLKYGEGAFGKEPAYWLYVQKRFRDEAALFSWKAGKNGVAINWGYIAGFFDGDGGFDKSRYTMTMIGFYNTNLEMLERIRLYMRVGNRICKHKQSNPRYKDMYRFRVVAHKEVERIIGSILPFLVIKQNEAGAKLNESRNKKWQNYRALANADPKPLAKLYKSGVPLYEIADLIAVTRPTLATWFRKHEIPIAIGAPPSKADKRRSIRNSKRWGLTSPDA